MANHSPTALASLAILIQESSLRSHIVLEVLIANDEISEKGLLELTCYLDTAWIVARQTMKTPPKALCRSRDALRSWLDARSDCLSPEMAATLCGGLQVADSIWKKAPGNALLDAMIMLRSRLERVDRTDQHTK